MAPGFSTEPKTLDTTFSSNDVINLALSVEDETKGAFYYSLDGNSEQLIENYTANDQKKATASFRFRLQENGIRYSSKGHLLEVFARDEFGLESKRLKFPIEVLSKPDLKRVDLPDMADPFKPVEFEITYDDFDAGKTLYIYIKYDGKIEKEQFPSNGKQGQKQTISHKFSEPGNYTVTFMLSSQEQSPETGHENSKSGEISDKHILLTNAPKVSCALTDAKVNYFGSGETFEIMFTVHDDKKGAIEYYIDSQKVFTDDNNVQKDYTVPNGQEFIVVTTNITIPSHLVYDDNSIHNLTISAIDNFNLVSQPPCSIFFKVRSMPKATGIELNTSKIYSDSEYPDIKITSSYYNDDENKPLSFYIKENINGPEKLLGTIQKPTKGTGSTTFVHEIQTKSYMNLPLIFWIEDDENPAEDFRNGESNNITKYINVTSVPKFSCDCFEERYFGKKDVIKLSGLLQDDTAGEIKFSIVGNDQRHYLDMSIPYNATHTKGKTPMDFSPNISIPDGLQLNEEYTLIFYPVDEFGVENPKPIPCPFRYKSKPILKDLRLSTDKPVDNDEKVNISGNLIDYDNGKTIYIYQQIGLQEPVKLGSIESDGTENKHQKQL
ncbi:hypothetical protein TVAG_195750 [Trichomonas vaginalis G3]|uniref:Uncharacterized protein n=1 Tax=Trichomonas vaginalis (strain ATCC PRA-98 / G3) TaxID=412133 RepID=A2ETL4_TRIV3|nr:hypothetical protein TVAGG3_0403960 [Trichomonas vaginalis G3]EAY03982.1 hypothetical protein TVAG_195750 [Trichomonas vaginalis G3]KAI5534896.1 hypothetical protein TVAGG3_0403960 [Trichomonas vaginalis G3]|eukprot:XP_001316205.1 hypothetical protein [Trichomonas vaginalis G3]